MPNGESRWLDGSNRFPDNELTVSSSGRAPRRLSRPAPPDVILPELRPPDQTHVPRYNSALLKKVEAGEIDSSFVIIHRLKLENGLAADKTFRDKHDGCIKVVLRPSA